MSSHKLNEPFIHEWFTFTYDENGNIPPESEWIKHTEERVVITTDRFRALEQKLAVAEGYLLRIKCADNLTYAKEMAERYLKQIEEAADAE